MRILVVKSSIPTAARAGTDIVSYHLLRLLSLDHRVSFLGVAHSMQELEGTVALEPFCEGVHAVLAPNKRSFIHQLVYKLWYLIRVPGGQSLQVSYSTPNCLKRKLISLTSEERYDLVIMEYWYTAPLKNLVRGGASTALLIHDAAFVEDERRAKIERNALKRTWLSLFHRFKKWEELSSIGRFENVFALSSADVRHIVQEGRGLGSVSFRKIPISVVERSEDLPSAPPLTLSRPSLYFIGNLRRYNNYDAVIYFLEEIYPHLIDQLGEVDFAVVGGYTPHIRSQLLGMAPVHLMGYVDDIQSGLASYSVCVAPLRIGSGIKIKILEAFMLGKPVVTSSVGAEGIDFYDEHPWAVQDRPEAFAREVVRLLTEKGHYDRVKAHQRSYAVQHLTIESNRKPVAEILAEVTTSGSR
jgi:glycosyltransferase involved in cell wall biosynthesis